MHLDDLGLQDLEASFFVIYSFIRVLHLFIIRLVVPSVDTAPLESKEFIDERQ